MPTDTLFRFCAVMKETVNCGLLTVKNQQEDLGNRVRKLLEEKGFKSVAARGFEAPGVVVCYTDDPDIKSGKKFKENGLQIAAGVPLQCDEPADFQTFRLGLFGLDKLHNIDRTVEQLHRALDDICS
jgi:aspartate aminotransferase-like enzyme